MATPAFAVQTLATEPQASLVIVHGLAEYAARYQTIAAAFAERGISTFASDLTGHGAHARVRTHVDSFDLFVDEASRACDSAALIQPNVPMFVWGHSMGTIVALQLVGRGERDLSGVILSSSATDVFKRKLNPLHPLFRVASRVAPRLRIPLGLDPVKISADEATQRAYASNPLIPSTASLRLLVEFARACESARSDAAKIRLPALIVHGEEDAIAPHAGSQELFDLMPAPDKTLKIYPRLRHELHNERSADRAAFFELLVDWTLARAHPRGAAE